MPQHFHAPARLLVPAILLAALLPAPSVRAEARITGELDAMRVEARDAPIEEVLVALGASFGLQYRSAAPLSRRITGTYEGSLQRVVMRLLDGYDFVIKAGSGTIEITVYGVVQPAEALASKAAQVTKTPPTARELRQARRKRDTN